MILPINMPVTAQQAADVIKEVPTKHNISTALVRPNMHAVNRPMWLTCGKLDITLNITRLSVDDILVIDTSIDPSNFDKPLLTARDINIV